MKNIYFIIHEILTSFFYYQIQCRKTSDNVSPSSSIKIISVTIKSSSENAIVQTILYLCYILIVNLGIISIFFAYINFIKDMYISTTGEFGKLIIKGKF